MPQLDVSTFPSQLFWLAITFGLLFLVMWRVAMPKIGSVIEARRHRIEGDLNTAEKLRGESNAALAAYEASLVQARARANVLAAENHKKIAGEIEAQKAKADAAAQAAMADAENRIKASRVQAEASVKNAAGDVAAAIVERLIGETVNAADAAKAVPAGKQA